MKNTILKNRLFLFVIFIGLFSLAYQIGAMSEVSEEEADIFMEEFEKLIKDIDAVGISVHNTSLTLPMFVPGLGAGWGLFSAWSTGYAFATISTVNPELIEIAPLSILYISPFGMMELLVYSMAMSRSYILIKKIIKKSNLQKLVKPTIIEFGIAVGTLFAAGFLEHYLIELAKESANGLPGL